MFHEIYKKPLSCIIKDISVSSFLLRKHEIEFHLFFITTVLHSLPFCASLEDKWFVAYYFNELPTYGYLRAIQRACHRPRGEGVKQDIDKV